MDFIDRMIGDLAKLNTTKPEKGTDTTTYGVIVQHNGSLYVQLDGASSDVLTPIDTVSFIEPGDRVTVTIKNHTAMVTGNVTKPSAANSSLSGISESLANKLDASDLDSAIRPLQEAIDSKPGSSEYTYITTMIDAINSVVNNNSSRLDTHDSFIYTYNRSPNVLWSGNVYPEQSDTVTLIQNVSIQGRGIVLHWQPYDTEIQNKDHVYTFIPKTHTPGSNVVCFLSSDDAEIVGCKSVTIFDDHIVGSSSNSVGSTAKTSGITTTNNHWKLTQILGV